MTTTPIETKTVHRFDDIGWLVEAEKHEHHIDFALFEINGAEDRDGVLYLQSYDGPPTADLDEAIWALEGYVKWDGCSNWHTNSACMIHFCRPEQMRQLGAAMVRCNDIANSVFNFSAAPEPPVTEIAQPSGEHENTAAIVQNGPLQAVKVIVHTSVADETRRRILMRMALSAVTAAEKGVAELSDEDAAALLKQLVTPAPLNSRIYQPPTIVRP